MHINSLVFLIAPRVNAAGRMDDAKKAVQLFIANNFEQALFFAEQLHADNIDRKEADSSITEEALSLIKNSEAMIHQKTTVLYQPHWHKGVVGIVASRLIDHYYRPTIVLTKSGEVVAGSARSVNGFNLYEAIHACREYLLGYGGHFAAAGMTLLPEQVTAFSNKFEEVVSATININSLNPEQIIDSVLSFSEITPSFYTIQQQMEPFGPENLRPVFLAKNLTDTGYSKIVKELHIRFSLMQNNIIFSGIGFNMAEKFDLLLHKKPVDVIFSIDENEWNGNKNLQLKVIDLQASIL